MDTPGAVGEMQGLYGTFSFPEKLLQQIWDRRDFADAGARALDGRTVEILHPGRWNRLGGPDFQGARLRIDGRPVAGDVEVHLHEADWAAHRHAHDPAYDRVMLHVVLFPPRGEWTRGAEDRRIPVLALLPLLHRGLEEYAAEDAVESLAGRPMDRAGGALGSLGETVLRRLLRGHAGARWSQKTGFARERIRRLGWAGACHHAALEILGYRFNRAPMLAVATEFPPEAWRSGKLDTDAVFEGRRDRWTTQGVRPLNHPRLRLRQYAAWMAARPAWPERLRGLAGELADAAARAAKAAGGEGGTRAARKAARLPALRKRLAGEVCGDAVTGSRLDNLVCDGFLPLLAAEGGHGLEPLWADWFAGDAPEERLGLLRKTGVFDGAAKPAAHGPLQGLLGWLLARERRDLGADAAFDGRRGT